MIAKICLIIVGILMLILYTSYIVKDVKKMRREAPYGKVFKREFANTIDKLHRAYSRSKNEPIHIIVNSKDFKVKAEEYAPKGLQYSSIPMYKCYDVYINDELVCKEHIIRDDSKDKVWFEFSGNRKRDEIIDIINATKDSVNEILKQSNKEMYKRLGLSEKSFFDYSFNNDTEDI